MTAFMYSLNMGSLGMVIEEVLLLGSLAQGHMAWAARRLCACAA